MATMSKKKKVALIVTASVLAVIVIATIVTCCLLFIQEKYEVDLNKILEEGSLKFNDEFNGNALNQDIEINGEKVSRPVWNITDTFYDNEKDKRTNIRRGAYWDMSQVGVSDGALTITTEKKGDHYYTAGLTTLRDENNIEQGYESKYGYYEMKCILPKGYGQWAAFWMMSDEFKEDKASGKECGAEIDIFEAPSWPKSRIQSAVHKGGYKSKHSSIFNADWLTADRGDIYDSYHTYGLFWDENCYKFYIDRECVWTTSYNKDVSQVEQWLFISIEIGGKDPVRDATTGELVPVLGDNPWIFAGGKNPEKNEPGWSSEFKIDYVKVWDIPDGAVGGF